MAAYPPTNLCELRPGLFVEPGQHPARGRIRNGRPEQALMVHLELLRLQPAPGPQHHRDREPVRASEQGLAGALFTTSQQTGAAVGLAVLATAAAAATGHSGSPVDGYRLSFLIATALAVLATIIVALQLGSTPRRVEPQRRQPGPDGTPNARTAAQLDER